MILLLLFSFSYGLLICSDTTNKMDLIPCIKTLDLNNDDIITEYELSLYNFTLNIPISIIMNRCDLDHDGLLTMIDYNNQFSCMNDNVNLLFVCNECKNIGF